MRKLTSAILVVVMLTASLLLTSRTTNAQTQSAFEAELAAYASWHTREETAAYAQQRINQMTNTALGGAGSSMLEIDTEELLFEKPIDDGG